MFFKPIIDLWSGPVDLAADLGLPAKNVRRWVDGDSIPADWFAAVVRAAEKRGFDDVTLEMLADLAEQRRLARTSHDEPDQSSAAA